MPANTKDGCTTIPTYSAPIAEEALPKYKMPQQSSNPKTVFNMIKDQLLFDGASRQNLATFCTTWAEPEVRDLMDAGYDKNMIDKDLYPQTAEIEQRCVHILADLFNSPTPKETLGCSTIGSSEAAMLGGLALKWQWRNKRKAQGLSTENPNIVTGPVQICWKKFAKYFDVEHREVEVRENAIGAHPDDFVKYIDENTIGVVPTFGLTFTCAYEDVQGLSNVLDKLQKEKGLDVNIHVDAASGGFIAPFVEDQKKLIWDFRLPRVKSMNLSAHKYGLAPLGLGWVIWREAKDLPDDLVFYVNYLGGNMPTFALNFSRPGGQIIAQYYILLRLGREGYQQVQESCMRTAQYLADEIKKMGPFEMLYDGRGGLPAVCYKLKDGVDHGFTLAELGERMALYGWKIATYPMPKHREKTLIQRALIRQGVTTDMMSEMVDKMGKEIAFLKARKK